MKRDDIDLTAVPARQQAAHERLVEWARWCGSGRGGHDTHPMFRGYVPYLYPEVHGLSQPVDIQAAIGVQRAYTPLPEVNRAALRWWYVFPFISPGRVQRQLAMTRDGLALLVVDSRSMIWNRLQRGEKA